ncbi:glycosyltransferase [Peredibacter starrii]|uniref:Glycosyltransferase n=1 Tax=Peredibacter starrii TaxID=28202 RepID=A0AAX4HRG9_9BACT|nr:glycosyltransferase [Peredibacter starrii]WPU65827.1 glycosyltransferase [Peredibacter starrii]
MKPAVSIIVPSYNHERYISLLIESIYAQSFKDFELVVVDDGSKDGSVQLLRQLSEIHGFRLISKENEGICKTINRGLRESTGNYVLIIGSDDILPLNRLKEQVEYLRSHPEVDVIAGSVIQIDMEGKEVGKNTPRILGAVSFEQMLMVNRVSAATCMIRRSVYTRWGMYKEDHVFEDYYMWLNVLYHGGKIVNLPNVFAYYRISNPNLEKKFNWYYKGVMQAFDEFKNDSRVEKARSRYALIYAIKLSLLLGSKFFENYSNVHLRLNAFGKLIVSIVAFNPEGIRNFVLKLLKLKT